MRRQSRSRTVFMVIGAITGIARGASADVEIRPAAFLSDTSRQTALNLKATNTQAAAAFTAVQNEANGVLGNTPRPQPVLYYEGILETDPRRIDTQDRLRDMDMLALVGQAYIGDPRPEYAAFIKTFVWAWGTTYVPTGNPINENKLEAIFAGYYMTKSQFTSSERTTLENWMVNIANLENGATSTNNWETKRFKIIAEIALATNRSDLLNIAVNRYRNFVPNALYNDGSSKDFHERDALSYHTGAVNPLMAFCLIAEQQQVRIDGKNLYEWQASNGGSVKKSVHFLDPYVLGTQTHMEFQNSTVAFDAQRCAAGIQQYCPHIWQPTEGSADEIYEMASGFEPSLSSMAASINGSSNTQYPSWLTVMSKASVNLDAPVIHSFSSQETGNEAHNILDGDTSDNVGARWSANNMPQWVIIDYRSAKSFVRSRVWTYLDRAYRYTIEASNSPTTGYTMIVDRRNNTSSGQPITNDFSAVSARYIRLTVTGAYGYTGTWASITELEMVQGTTTPTVPTAPGSLAATAASSSSVSLTWLDNSSNEDGFSVERSPNQSSWTVVATTGAGATSRTDTGLQASTTYYYRVRAFNTAGNSAYSNVASVTTQGTSNPVTVNRAPSADAWIRDDGTNGGTDTTLRVKRGSATFQRRSLFRFDVSGTGISSVTSAKLRLYVTQLDGAMTVQAYAMTDSWSETGVTWSNWPGAGSSVGSVQISSVNQWIEIDVTSYIASQMSGDGTASIVLDDPALTNLHVKFNSREASTNRPQLVITGN